MSDQRTTVSDLRKLVAEFVAERDWQRFHDPKNLSMALAIEAAELMEHFQWVRSDELVAVTSDGRTRTAIGEELADVTCYLLALANALQIDLSDAVRDKMTKNARKYPADEFRGIYRKR